MSAPRGLVAGRVGRPHGLDGSFHVTRPVEALLRPGGTVEVAGVARELARVAGTPQRPIARLAGCEDRDGAEALRGEDLLVPRGEEPVLGRDEWWAQELEGCEVVDGERAVGVVRRLRGLPSCEALEVRRADGTDLLVPLVRDAVRSVDVRRRRIEVSLAFLGEAP